MVGRSAFATALVALQHTKPVGVSLKSKRTQSRHKHIQTCLHTQTHSSMTIDTHIRTRTRTRTRTHTHARTRTHPPTHTHTDARAHTHSHTHTPTHTSLMWRIGPKFQILRWPMTNSRIWVSGRRGSMSLRPVHREMCREVSCVSLDSAERSRTLVPLSDRLCGESRREEKALEIISVDGNQEGERCLIFNRSWR